MKAEESISDVATCDLQLFQHQQLWAEIVAHEETYAQAVAMGQRLQEQDIPNPQEVNIPFIISYIKVMTDVIMSCYVKGNVTLKKQDNVHFHHFKVKQSRARCKNIISYTVGCQQ